MEKVRSRKKDKQVENKPAQTGLEAPKKIKLLVTIVDRSKSDFYLDVLEGFGVNMQMVSYGHGTAPSNVLHYLGISQLEKAVIFSVVQEDIIKEILNSYEDKYFKLKKGKGIAFVVPISSIIGVSIYQFLCKGRDN